MFYGWYVVFATILLNSLGIGLFASIIGLFFPALRQVYGYSQAQVSSILMFATLGGLVATVSLGKIYATKSIRKLVIIFGIFQAVTFVVLSIVNSLPLFYGVGALMGFATFATTTLSVPALITRWFDDKRAVAMGIAMAGAGLGPGIMAPLISSTIAKAGYQKAFIILAVIAATCHLVSFLIIRDNPEDIGLKALGADKANQSKKEADNRVENAEVKSFTLGEALKSPMIIPFIILSLTAGFVVQGVLGQIPSFYTYLNFSPTQIGTFVGIYAVLAGACKILIGIVYDKKGPVFGNYLFYSFMTLAFVMGLLITGNHNFVYAYILFAGLGMGINVVSVPIITGILFGKKYYTQIYSLIVLISSIGGMAGMVGTGIIIDKAGYKALFVMAIAGGLLQMFMVQITLAMMNCQVKCATSYRNT